MKRVADLASLIRTIPDYPKPGILFRDITTLLGNADGFRYAVDKLADRYRGRGISRVAGIEARGFILAAPVAYHIGAGFVPVRKKGKLPAATYEESYDLEYGQATVEVHIDAFRPGDRVLIVDDVLATGGTAAATAELVRRAGGVVVGVSVLIELTFLGGRSKVPGLDVHALMAV